MSFLSSIPTWGWFDIGFNVAVLVALGGETDIISAIATFRIKGDFSPPPEFRWLVIISKMTNTAKIIFRIRKRFEIILNAVFMTYSAA